MNQEIDKDELTELEKNFGKISEKRKLGICISFLESCDLYEKANRILRGTLLEYYKTIDKTLRMLEEKNREIYELKQKIHNIEVTLGFVFKLEKGGRILIHCEDCNEDFPAKFGFLDSLMSATCPRCNAKVF